MIEVNTISKRVLIDGVNVKITRLARKVLIVLMSKPDNVFSKDQLIDLAWGPHVFVNDVAAVSAIGFVRKALGKYRDCIENVHGEGYRFNPSKYEWRLVQ